MTRVTVWAPDARRVDVISEGATRPMARTDGGWWEGGIAPDAAYAFRIDGEGPFPDPRSRWQPDGVHGPSRLTRPAEFEWTDDGFQPPPLDTALIYELHVGTFSAEGTFDGAIQHLPHLLDLGVTHVQVMPIASFPGRRNWGYDTAQPFAVHHGYGGPAGLVRLVNACHARGLAVLVDVVYNHLGPEGNYLSAFGPYFTERYRTPWGTAVNFDDARSPEVRRFVLDNARMWLQDYRIDGLRLDAVHAIFDQSAVHILEDLALEAERVSAETGRHKVVIAESDLNDPRLVRPRELGGYGLDAQWSDDFHHAIHAAFTGEQTGYYRDFGATEHIARAMTGVFVYDGRYSAYRDRIHGRGVGNLSGHRFLGYLQSHDQVGNRACGERIAALCGPDLAMVGAALVFFSPFVPMIFMGEEWAASSPFLYFTDHADQQLGEAVRRGRRREFAAFGWDPERIPDPQAESTMRASRLDWHEQTRDPHARVLAWYRTLVGLRREYPELTDGRRDGIGIEVCEHERWIRIERGRLCLAANTGDQPLDVPLSADSAWDVIAVSNPDGGMRHTPDSVHLPHRTAVILVER